jgi:hypothetical protein
MYRSWSGCTVGGWTVLVVACPEGPAADAPGRLFVWPYRRSQRLCSRKEVLSSSSSAASEGIRRFRSLYAVCDSEFEEEASAGGVSFGSLEAMLGSSRLSRTVIRAGQSACSQLMFEGLPSRCDVFDD